MRIVQYCSRNRRSAENDIRFFTLRFSMLIRYHTFQIRKHEIRFRQVVPNSFERITGLSLQQFLTDTSSEIYIAEEQKTHCRSCVFFLCVVRSKNSAYNDYDKQKTSFHRHIRDLRSFFKKQLCAENGSSDRSDCILTSSAESNLFQPLNAFFRRRMRRE